MENVSYSILTEESPNGEADKTPPSESKEKEGFQVPTLDISQERSEELVEVLASRIVDNKMEAPALLFLIPFRPISPIASQLTLLPFAPLLEAFDIPGFDYVAFLKDSDNVNTLVKRIEAKARSRDEAKRKEPGENWFSKLMNKIGL